MSMYIDFEPHSFYKGWAIRPTPTIRTKWQAITYDGVRGAWRNVYADTLRELRAEINAQLTRSEERDKLNRRMIGEEVNL